MEAVSPEIAIRRLSAVVEEASSGRTDLCVLEADCRAIGAVPVFPLRERSRPDI